MRYLEAIFSRLTKLAIKLLIAVGLFSGLYTAAPTTEPSRPMASPPLATTLEPTATSALERMPDMRGGQKRFLPDITDAVPMLAPTSTAAEDALPVSDNAIMAAPETAVQTTAIPPTSPDASTPAAAAEPNTAPSPPSAPAVPIAELTLHVRKSVVNVFCTSARGGSFRPITGSGVIIDPRGIVLTNAHVAQYFLLEDDPLYGIIDCVLRDSSPAKRAYEAKLLYLPPTWVVANAAQINNDFSTGTGEHDYALLLITASLRKDIALPDTFPFVAPERDVETVAPGASVLLAGYPAGFLDGILAQRDLFLVSSITDIKRRYTFSNVPPPLLDVVGLGGNILAQSGASGAAVVQTTTGRLIGIVVTSTLAPTTEERNLNAVTLGHIGRSIFAHERKTLEQFLANDPKSLVAAFAEDSFLLLKARLEKELQ